MDSNDILEAAFDMLSCEGEAAFSVRKLAARIGIDPMTVLHHFGSREQLLRRIADRALASIALPVPGKDWKADLMRVAEAYRDLARRHPRLFHLHFRYNATGPADHASSEVVYQALRRTGLPDSQAAGLGLSFYAFVLGFGQAEIEGLLKPASREEQAELLALDPDVCPATLAFVPAFSTLDADQAFVAATTAFIEGIAVLAGKRPPRAKSG